MSHINVLYQNISFQMETEVRSFKGKSILLGDSIERKRKMKLKALKEGIIAENKLNRKIIIITKLRKTIATLESK